MNQNIQKLSELETMLVEEGEKGPILCLSRHEVVLVQENNRRKLLSLPVLTAGNDYHIILPCKNNNSRNRLCAHNKLTKRLDPLVYSKEIEELRNAGIIDTQTEQELWDLNADAKWAIYDFDAIASKKAANGEFAQSKDKLEALQQEIWEKHVNPLRKKLLNVVRSKLEKADESLTD